MLETHRQTGTDREVLRIKRLHYHLVAAAARGPIASAIDHALDTGVVTGLTPQPERGDHVAMAIHDASRILVVVDGSASALVLHHDGTFNWVDGGAARFQAHEVERIVLLVAPPMKWQARQSLVKHARTTALAEMPARIRAQFGDDSVVLLGSESRMTEAEPEAEPDEDGLFDLLAEVAEIDHRATPAVVRREVSPGRVQPPDAWRVSDRVFEASDFESPVAGAGALEVVAILGDPAGPPPTASEQPPPPEEEPTLREPPQPRALRRAELEDTIDKRWPEEAPVAVDSKPSYRMELIAVGLGAVVGLFSLAGFLVLVAIARTWWS